MLPKEIDMNFIVLFSKTVTFKSIEIYKIEFIQNK